MENLCGCEHAVPENGGGDSATWWYVCKLTGEAIDPKECKGCPRVGRKSTVSQSDLYDEDGGEILGGGG